ncbi:hypothetical protein [Streptomyces spiramenti]|uniref:Uncharacterized protein n=1 Tax=Streptomyces spiramenti TaxID=2720606 RepID=A0ABX1AHC6_9ACTN|nr:hypothetical protein [Streptomyces spiramenti]NJP65051.1 hypothetical protein [Streptomyces spiramenti]
MRTEVEVAPADLLSVRRAAGPPSPEGVRTAEELAHRHATAREAGRGTVVLDGAVHDAASAALAEEQLRQWLPGRGAADHRAG